MFWLGVSCLHAVHRLDISSESPDMGGVPGGRALFTPLKDKDWAHDLAAAADVAVVGWFDERFADRAVEIGRRVVFRAAGEAPTCEVRQSSVLRPPAVSCILQVLVPVPPPPSAARRRARLPECKELTVTVQTA